MDNEDNITFETMPDFGSMFQTNPLVSNEEKPMEMEKEYDSLYFELLEKCNPSHYSIESVGLEKFKIANELYSLLLDCKEIANSMGEQEVSEDALKELKNRAMDELGIHISTTKKFNELKAILDPNQYINRQPYDKELVAKAADLYNQLINNRNDIRALEELENDPQTAIVMDEHDFIVLKPEEYHKKHPEGKHQIEISESLRRKELSEEENYYRTHTPTEYLKQYPHGQFAQKAAQSQEHADFVVSSAEDYISHYPQGRFVEEAQYFINNNGRKYIKKYPSGRYAQDIEDKRTWLMLACTLIFLLTMVIVVGLISK